MNSYPEKNKVHRVKTTDDKKTQYANAKGAESGPLTGNGNLTDKKNAKGDSPASNNNDKSKEKGTGKKSQKPKRPLRIFLYTFICIVVIAICVLLKFYHDISANPAALFNDEAVTPSPTLEPFSTPTPTPLPTPTPDPASILKLQSDLEFMKNRVNILVLGLDESTEREHWGSFRTDTMILVTIDFETNDVIMISVPRDSYVKICNSGGTPIPNKEGTDLMYGKINSAFPTGGGAKKNGYGYAMGTVSYLLGGIPINYYVGFNMNVVKEIVNAMGGLDYEVDLEVNMNGRQLLPGLQHMDGQAVLDYCRQRKGSSDIERIDRQQRMLTAIFNELKNTGQIVNIPKIYTAVENNIQTNLSFKQISSLALLASNMQLSQLERRTVEGTFLNMRAVSYWGLYTNKIAEMVKEVFGVSASIDSDINVTNVRNQIEANRQLIALELNAAKAAIDTADTLLKTYGDYLSDDIKAQLKAAKNQCEDAYKEEDKYLLDTYTPPLEQLNNIVWAGLANAGLYNPTPENGEDGRLLAPYEMAG